MREVLVLLYVLSAVLPIVGFGRLLWRTQRGLEAARRTIAERGHSLMTLDDVSAKFGGDVREPFLNERRDLIWDIVFVGFGLVLGALASILALYPL